MNIDKCLNCKNALCKKNCPLENNIPDIIEKYLKEEEYLACLELFKTSYFFNILPEVCQRQCETNCVRKKIDEQVHFPELEKKLYYLIDEKYLDKIIKDLKSTKEETNQHILIVGAGPAGLSCAFDNALASKKVTLIDKKEKIGGIIRYEIPDFRLDKDLLKFQEKLLDKLQIDFLKQNFFDISKEQLKQYTKIVFACGLEVPRKWSVLDNLAEKAKQKISKRVFQGRDILDIDNKTNWKEKFEGKDIIVLGGGNVAFDAARTLKKLGANPKIVYRRDKDNMPGTDLEDVIKDGIKIDFLTDIENIYSKEENKLEVEMFKNELIDIGEKRLSPKKIEATNYIVKTDYLVLAIGSVLDEKIETFCKNNINTKLIGDAGGYVQTIASASRSGKIKKD